jgi:hypothetical protein
MLVPLCLVLLMGASVGASQTPPGRGQRGAEPPAAVPGADADTLSDAQLLAMLDAYAIVQAQQQLGISDDKYGAFAARLKRLQDTRRRNQRERRMIIQELRRLAGPRATETADEATIRNQLMQLRTHDDKAAAEMRKAYDALDEILDPQQQARFRLLEEVIEQRKLDLLVRARDKVRLNRPK